MVVEMIKDMNYACDLKESSGMISNKYKKIFESLIKISLKAYEKGMMDAQKLKEFREILPQRSEMFSKEHTVDYSTLTKEVDMTLNDIQVQNLIDEEYVPKIKAA